MNSPDFKQPSKEEEGNKTERRSRSILHNLGFENFDELKGKKVLEIGSGDAEFGLTAKKNGVDIICSDIDSKYQKQAQSDGVDCVVVNALNTPFEDNSFDTILSHGSVPIIFNQREHVINTLKEMKRILKKGGEFRFGPTHLVAGALDLETLFSPGEEKTISEEDNASRRRKRSLEVLRSFDPNITETVINLDGIFPKLYYTMKKI
ncbi:MAG: class I SAM-dependent methyltransferase [Candidatus Pacebacteria bacterium]|nr:class I SAM-dependent methyltransferase [Candidatus Paceibacterota bacterium]